jgi:hypothetical protein
VAFRYENDIELLRIWDAKVGPGVAKPFVAASSSNDGLDVRNLVILDAQAPRPAPLR